MNAGMFGMGDGRGMAGRKLAAVVGRQSAYIQYTAFANAGIGPTLITPTIPNNIKTRAWSVSGRGALRCLHIAHQTDQTSGSATYELIIDGARVLSIIQSVSSGASYGPMLAGSIVQSYGSVLSPVPDYIPFDSGCELWVTAAAVGAGTGYYLSSLVDIHQ